MVNQSLQSMRVDDLSGGMTDRYIEGKPNQFQMAENCVLRLHGGKGKLISRPGSAIYNEEYFQVPAGEVRIVDLEELEDQLFQFTGLNVYYIDSGWNTLLGPGATVALDEGSITNYISKAKWNKHLLVCNDAYSSPIKIFKDSGDDWRLRALGLPAVATTMTITPNSAAAREYIYAFVRRDEYTVGTTTFQEVSAVSFKSVSSSSEPGAGTPTVITNIPALTGDLYNVTTSTIEVYRTIDGGTQFWKTGQVTNGTTTFNDTKSDNALILEEELYTSGGVQDFTQCPKSKYIAIAGDKAFYFNIKEGSETLKNRVRQSIPGALYASPETFYVDLDDEILGGGVVDQTPIAFCDNGKIYRIEGSFDETGSGFLEAREISRTVTLASNRSIVSTREGLFFAANSGFYFTDGNSVVRISDEFSDSYADLVASDIQKSRIYGTYNEKDSRVEWACQRDSSSDDNDSVFVCHLKWANRPFTTWSGGEDNAENFAPTCLKYLNGDLLRGDTRGYVLKHTDSLIDDVRIDVDNDPEDWYTLANFPDFRWVSFDFGTTEFRKWVPELICMFDNQSNLSILPQSNRDNTGVFNDLKPITHYSNFTWGDQLFTWEGEQELLTWRWNYNAVIDSFRRFPAGDLRCNYKQIRLSPAFVEIDSSDILGTASFNATTNVLTLDDLDMSFIDDPIGYVVVFAADDLATEYRILDRPSATTLLLDDPSGLILSDLSEVEWSIKGYRKNQLLSLLSFDIRFTYIGRTQQAYKLDE